MRLIDSTTKRFGLRIVLPAILILAGTFATVIVSLQEMAGGVNHIEGDLTARSAHAAVESFLRRIGDSNNDYASWDDAVRNLYGTVNTNFVAENFQSSTATSVFFDTAYLLDENGREVFALHDGHPVDVPAINAFGPTLPDLISDLPTNGRDYAVKLGMVDGKWGLAGVAVGPVVPTSADFAGQPSRARFLVIAHAFDAAAVKRLGEDFVIDGLHLAATNAATANAIEIADTSGKTVGALAWSPPRLGTEAHARVSTAVFLMLALLGLIMIFLIAVAMRSLREVQKGEAQARHAAAHDPLSGLPNRRGFGKSIEDALAGKRQRATTVAVVYLDLDGFKEVNDAYGHETGDRLLKRIAEGFASICAPRPLARVGGDEFAVLVDETSGVRIGPELGRRLIAYLAQPIDIDGRIIVVGTSVGIAIAETPDLSAEELLRRADVAMYQAKQDGPNRIYIYHPSIDTVRHERLEIAADLRRALGAGEIELAYQPVVDASSREIIGAEALLRWTRPHHGSVPPSVFVPIAEEAGLIDELGAWMLRHACADAHAWPGIRLLVNVSPTQFRNPSFEVLVSTILGETGLQPARLEIEVPESFFVVRPEQARKAMGAIRNLGISVTLDDFGTGFSSIGHLRSFGFAKIKLDRAMIAGVAADPRAQRLVQATIALADALELKAAAEGVETDEEAMMLRLAGCRELQGPFFAKPCSASQLAARVAGGPATAAEPRRVLSA